MPCRHYYLNCLKIAEFSAKWSYSMPIAGNQSEKVRLNPDLFLGNDIGDPAGIGFSLNLWGKFTVTFAIFVRPFPIHG